MNDSGNSKKEFRLLMSNAGDWLCEMLETVTQEMVGPSVPVVSRIPQTFKEKDLLDTAASEEFDLAIFLLNNIFYASNETPFLEENSIALVAEVVARYGKPVIALYGRPDDDPAYPGRVLEAGATAVLRLPFKLLELQNALKRCLE